MEVKKQVPEGYKLTEVGVIPVDWEVFPLSELSLKISVGIASSATHAYRNKGVVLFRNQNIKNGYLDDSDILYISPDYEEGFKNKRLKANDLLTARTGYPGATCIVPSKYEGAQSFTTLITRPDSKKVKSDYLSAYINSESGQIFFDNNQIGGGQKNVNAGSLKTMPIPLPPSFDEQTAIANALSDADALIAALDDLIEKKRQIKQGTMQQLLTPPHRGGRRLEGFSGAWFTKKLGGIGDFKNGINKGKEDFGFGNRFINLMDVFWKPEIDSSSKLGLVNCSDSELNTYNLKKGDVLFVRSSVKPSGVGLTSVLKTDFPETVYSGFLIRFRTKDQLSDSYKRYCFYEEKFRNRLIESSTVSANTNINQDALKELKLSFPPTLAEQTAIATILSDMDTEIEALEGKRAKYQSIKSGMMQELLTGRGRLV